MWAIVPVKRLDAGKQRLADVLDTYARHTLSRAMAEDVLSALAETRELVGILVVTSDPEVEEMAERHGALILNDAGYRDLNAAVRGGIEYVTALGADGAMIVHADAPLATSNEFELVLAAHRGERGEGPCVTIVPARDQGGTNCLAVSPADALPLCYGEDSYRKHLAAAEARGIVCRTLTLPGIGLDVDTRADLEALVMAPGDSTAQLVLRKIGVARRLRTPRFRRPGKLTA
jgi:2-phospho-L-lactate guanylyltransferase